MRSQSYFRVVTEKLTGCLNLPVERAWDKQPSAAKGFGPSQPPLVLQQLTPYHFRPQMGFFQIKFP